MTGSTRPDRRRVLAGLVSPGSARPPPRRSRPLRRRSRRSAARSARPRCWWSATACSMCRCRLRCRRRRRRGRRAVDGHGLPPAGAPSQTNVTLIRTGDDLVLIDAGAGAELPADRRQARGKPRSRRHRAGAHHQGRVHPLPRRPSVGRDRRFRRGALSECELCDLSGGMGLLDRSGHLRPRARLAEGHGAGRARILKRLEPRPSAARRATASPPA